MLKQWLLGSALFFISTYASAQCGGMVNVNGVCIPPDQASSPLHGQYTYGQPGQTSPVTPSPIVMQQKWADRWGTIAYDELNPIIGTATGMKNRRIAEKTALSQCRSKGGKKCKVATAYYNQCAVLFAIRGGGLTWATGKDVKSAQSYGMEGCRKDNSQCEAIYENCSMSEQYWVRQ